MQPLTAGLRVADEQQMHAVVNGVAGGNETECRTVQARGVLHVGVPEIDRHQRFVLKLERAVVQRADACHRWSKLPWEPLVPQLQ